MNRNYKVIWNVSLNCFMAVAEYAKARGKSSSGAVTSKASPTSSVGGGAKLLRLSALCAGLATAGLTMSPVAFAATGVNGAVTIGVANCATTASAGHDNSLAVGCSSVADLSSVSSVSFYERDNPDSLTVDTSTKFSSTAIGTRAKATEAGTSLGMNSSSKNLGVALGIQAKSENVAALAIGPAALAKGNTSLALGYQSAATQDFAQAIGNVASATGKGSLAVGHSARAEGYRSIAIGSADIDGAGATGTQSGVVYQDNQQTLAKGLDSIAIGSGAIADTTFGPNASGTASTAIGKTAKAQGPNALALGANSDAKNGTAVGSGAIVRNGGLAVGMHADAGPGVGFFPTSNVALGDDSKVTGGGFNVALGALAVAGDSNLSAQAYRPIMGIAVAGENAVGEVSIGGDSSGQYPDGSVYRRITNLAAGAADTDGVNVSQLKSGLASIASAATHFYSVNSTDTAAGNYNNEGATGTNALAAGPNATATGGNSVAIGNAAKSGGSGAVALGGNAKVGDNQTLGAMALGNGAEVITGNRSAAIGANASVSAHNALAVGYKASTTGQNSAAFGAEALAAGKGSLALGHGAEAGQTAGTGKISFDNAIAIGTGSSAIPSGAIALGFGAQAKNQGVIAIGRDAQVLQSGSLAVGTGATAQGSHMVVIGGSAGAGTTRTTGDGHTIVGYTAGSNMAGQDNTAIGRNAMTNATNVGYSGYVENTALGVNAGGHMIGIQNTALGAYAGQLSDGQNNVYIGHSAGRGNSAQDRTTGSYNVALGHNANLGLSVNHSVALGNQTKVHVDKGVALGAGSVANRAAGTSGYIPAGMTPSQQAVIEATTSTLAGVSVGDADNKLFRQIHGVAAGTENSDAVNVSQLRSLVDVVDANKIEYFSVNSTGGANVNNDGATGVDAIAIGKDTKASGISSTAVGHNAQTNNAYDVALGAGSSTDAAVGTSDVELNGTPYTFAGATPRGTVSVGSAGNERTITNVAAGRINEDSTDAINGSQLYATHQAIDALDTSLSTAGLDFAGNDGTVIHRKLGEQLNIVGGMTDMAATSASSENIRTVAKANGDLEIQLANELTGMRSISFLGDNVSVDHTGLWITDGPSVSTTGIDAGGMKIINVAAGVADTDAVNVSQLRSLGDVVDANKIEYFSVHSTGGANVNNDGATGDDAIAIGKGTEASGISSTAVGHNASATASRAVAVGTAASATGSESTALGSAAQAFAGSATAIGFGARADQYGATATGTNSRALGQYSAAYGQNAQANNAYDVALGAGSSTDAAVATEDIIINGKTYDFAGITPLSTVSVGKVGSERTITNVAAGQISDTSTDAINGSQLFQTNQAIGDLTQSIVNAIGGVEISNGGITKPSYTIGEQTFNTISEAINFMADGWYLGTSNKPANPIPGGGEGGSTTTPPAESTSPEAQIQVRPGDTLTLVGGDNINITQDTEAKEVTIATDPNLVVNSVTAGQTVMDNSGVSVGDNVHLGETGLIITGGPSVTTGGINAGNLLITNVAAGSIGAESTDAINGSQIHAINTSVANAFGGGSTVQEDGTVSAPSYTVGSKDAVVNNVGDAIDILNQGWTLAAGGNDSQVQSGDVVSLSNNDGNVVITHATDSGAVAFDLNENITVNNVNATTVNASTVRAGNTVINNSGVSFVNEAGEPVGPSMRPDGIDAGGYPIANVAPGVRPTDAANMGQLSQAVNTINHRIDRVESRADAGTAAAMAVAGLGQPYRPGQSMVSLGSGLWRGETGYALGISTLSGNGKWLIKGAATSSSRGGVGGSASINYAW